MKDSITFDEEKITFRKADEPTEIIWENQSIPMKEIILRRFILFIVTAACLAGSFFIIALLTSVTANNLINYPVNIYIHIYIYILPNTN